MMAFHQDGDVETYLLTIMNMVSSLYLDPTIGNFINVVVVRIILVEEEEAEVSYAFAIFFFETPPLSLPLPPLQGSSCREARDIAI